MMSVREGFFYTGLIGGLVLTVTGMRHYGYTGLMPLIVGFVVGIGLGFLCQKLYEGVRSAKTRHSPSGKDIKSFKVPDSLKKDKKK